nr:MAG TPA: hypothetical protein [Caudoviricetes sp.]
MQKQKPRFLLLPSICREAQAERVNAAIEK